MGNSFKARVNRIWLLLCIVLAGATALSVGRSWIIGLDMDEQYAVVLAYRIAKGDMLIREIWDPHQTSAILPALLIKVFLLFAEDNTFLLLYLRISGTLFQAIVSFLWYRVMRAEYGKRPALLTALVFFHTMAKWIVTPEFANQQLLFWILMILCLYCYEKNRKDRYCVYAGIAMCFTVLAYPSCVLLFVFYLIWLGRREKRGAIFLTLTCVAGAGIFTWLFLSDLSFSEFALYMEQILADPMHSEGILTKLAAYCREAAGLAVYVLAYLIMGLIIFFMIEKIVCKKIDWKEAYQKKSSIFLLVLCIAAVDQIRMWLFWHTPTVHPQLHYLLLYALGGFLYYSGTEEKRRSWNTLYALAWRSSLVGFGAVLLLTNLDLKSSFVHLLPGMLVALLFWCDSRSTQKDSSGTVMAFSKVGLIAQAKILCGVALPVLWVLFLIGARGYLVRADEGMSMNVFVVKQKALYGAAKNVYCSYMTGYQYNSDFLFIEENLEPGTRGLYIGRELLMVYLMNDMEICTPSVISTPVYNERYLKYYEMNPDKMPEVLIIDKGYFQAMNNNPEFISKWVKEEYNWEKKKESDFLWIVERR